MEDFYLLPVGDRLMQYDRLAVNTVVATWDEGIATGDIPISADLERFNQDYRKAHGQVRESGESYELGEDDMVIGTSALSGYEVDSAVNIYAGCYNNPFLIWGQYRKKWLRAPCRCPFSSTTPNWMASRRLNFWSGAAGNRSNSKVPLDFDALRGRPIEARPPCCAAPENHTVWGNFMFVSRKGGCPFVSDPSAASPR